MRNEGLARELINRVQNLRKDGGLEITDRINVVITPNEQMKNALQSFNEYVKSQVLADEIIMSENDGQDVEFDDFTLRITINKR